MGVGVAVGVAVAGREEVLAEAREPVQAKAERALAVARPVVAKAVPPEARRVEVKAVVPAEATRAQEEPAVGPRETTAIITVTTQ